MTPTPRDYTRHGPEQLGDTDLLALLLGSRPLARALLDEFGNAAGVASASPIALARHLGPARAARLHAAFALAMRAWAEPPHRPRVASPADAAAWFLPRFAGLAHEELHVLLLNRRLDVLALRRLSQGCSDHTLFDVRLILGEALRAGAQGLMLAHNHPSGDPEPSPEDFAATRRVVEGAALIGLDVLDHLVVAGTLWTSMSARGLLSTGRGATRFPSA